MTEIADIGDKESLEAWLADKPPELAILLAHRAAARVMPLYWGWCADRSTKGDLTDIAMWRILPISRVRAVYVTREVEAAAGAAAAAADAGADAALAAFAAATAASASATADTSTDVPNLADAADAASIAILAARAADAADIWEEVRRDAAAYLGTDMPAPSPLWDGGTAGIPPEIAAEWETTRDALTARIEAGETGWQFWIDWYEAQLTGADQNWEMLKEIVLIPDADWQKGAAHVNGLIEEIVEKYQYTARSDLSQAFPVDFSFDSLQRVMRMVGIQDDMAHLRDPAVVQSFLDDCDELRDTLQDFSDFAEVGKADSNKIAMLHLSANKVLAELQRSKDTDHLRARHIVRLAGRLEAFSKEEGARADMGEALGDILDDGIGLLRTVTRRHFGPAYTALAPLGQLTLDHVDQDEVVALFDQMIARLEALPSNELVALDEDGLNVFRDMIRELHEFRAAIAEASSDAFREVLEQRFAESIGGTGLAFGRFMETSSSAAGKGGRAVDGAVKAYKRVQGVGDIIEFVRESLSLGSLP